MFTYRIRPETNHVSQKTFFLRPPSAFNTTWLKEDSVQRYNVSPVAHSSGQCLRRTFEYPLIFVLQKMKITWRLHSWRLQAHSTPLQPTQFYNAPCRLCQCCYIHWNMQTLILKNLNPQKWCTRGMYTKNVHEECTQGCAATTSQQHQKVVARPKYGVTNGQFSSSHSPTTPRTKVLPSVQFSSSTPDQSGWSHQEPADQATTRPSNKVGSTATYNGTASPPPERFWRSSTPLLP